jgi:flagellar protein FlgJ
VIAPVSPSLPGAPETLSPERLELREAAEGFEAIMVRRMLASARAASFAEDTPLTGGGMKQYAAMRDEHLAGIVASSGDLGFARSIEERLAQHLQGKGEM